MKFFKGKKQPKIIIIEDGVVNTNEMCIITIPRSKEPSILYAKKRDLVGPNVDRPKKTKQFNPMDELLKDRAGRPFGIASITPKVMSRPQRYNKFQEALARNEKLTKKLEQLGQKFSQEEQKMPTRYEKIQARNDRLTLRLEQMGKEFGKAEKMAVPRNDETQYKTLALNPALPSTRRQPRNEMLNLDDSTGSLASRIENPSWIHDPFTPPAESTQNELYWDSFEGQDDTPPCLQVESLVFNEGYNKPGVDLRPFNSKSESGKFYSIGDLNARDATTVNGSRRPAPRINPTSQGTYPQVLQTSCSSACSSPASKSMQRTNAPIGFETIPDFSMSDGSYNQSGQIDNRPIQGMASPTTPSMRYNQNSSFNPFDSRNNVGSSAIQTTPASQRSGPWNYNNISTLRNRAWRNSKPPNYRQSPSLPRHNYPDSETIGDYRETDDNFQHSQRSDLMDSTTERGYDQENTPSESNLPHGSWEDVSPWLFNAKRPCISAIKSDNAMPIDNSFLNQRQWEDPSSIWEDSPSEQFNVQNPCLQPDRTSTNTPHSSRRVLNRLWDAPTPSSFNTKYSCLNPVQTSISKSPNWEDSPPEQFNVTNTCLKPVQIGAANIPRESKHLPGGVWENTTLWQANTKQPGLSPIKHSPQENWEDNPPWLFNSKNPTSLNPTKTYTIMPPDNRHFQQSKSSDFNNFPKTPPYDCSYETEYADVIGSQNDFERNISEGSSLLRNVSPPANRDYYSLIEETEDQDAQGGCFSKNSRCRENKNFIREHELINIYDD